ncbi:MAG: cupredoxin domain-containing protein [Gaiellaceae bacterium]
MARILLAAAAAAAAAAALALPASAATTVTVTMTDYHFALSATSVPHGVVVFKLTNAGGLPHDFSIAGTHSPMLTPGSTRTLRVTFGKAGSYAYRCLVTGHAAIGMKGVLTVR